MSICPLRHTLSFHLYCYGRLLLHVLYNGNNLWKKMFTNWLSFLIHEKMFANGANPLRIYSFSGNLYHHLPCPFFSNEGCHCRSPTKQRQCSSYSGHTHLQLLNRVILTKQTNTAVEYSAWAYDCSLKTPTIWFALERLQKSGRLQCNHCAMFKPARRSPLSWNK